MKTSLIIFILLSGAVLCAAQAGGRPEQPKAPRLRRSRPSAYITFERETIIKPNAAGEGEHQILLRFHNNSQWNLTVKVNGCRPEQEQCQAFYTVKKIQTANDKTKESDLPAGYGYGLLISSVRTVPSGESFLFTVSKDSMAEGLYIVVDFNYEWEIGGSSGSADGWVFHQATFFSFDVPKNNN